VGVRGSRGPVGSTCRGNGGRAPVGHPRGRNGPIFLSPYPAAPAGVGTCARALGRRGSSGTSMATPSPRGRSVDRWRIRWDSESRLPVATGPKRRRGPGSGAADVSALRRERLPAPGARNRRSQPQVPTRGGDRGFGRRARRWRAASAARAARRQFSDRASLLVVRVIVRPVSIRIHAGRQALNGFRCSGGRSRHRTARRGPRHRARHRSRWWRRWLSSRCSHRDHRRSVIYSPVDSAPPSCCWCS
jgi:hypothetical protein